MIIGEKFHFLLDTWEIKRVEMNNSYLIEGEEFDIIQNHPELILKFFDNIPYFFIIFQQNGTIDFINKPMKGCLGIEKDNVIGNNIFDILPNEIVELWIKKTNLAIKNLKPLIFDCAKNENEFKVTLIPMRLKKDREPKIIGVIELFYEEKLKKQAEEKIRRTKEHLEKLIHNTSEIIFSIDNSYKITLWNKTAENISGIKANKIIGKDIKTNNFIENNQEFQKFLDQKFKHENTTLKYIELKTIFGSIHKLKLSTSLVTNEKNVVTDIIFICEDITLKNEVHDQLMRGFSYILDDPKPIHLVRLFNNLISKNNKGLFITRSQYEKTISLMDIDHVTLSVLSDQTVEFAPIITDLKKLKALITAFVKKHQKSIICINRSDYLFTTFGFKQCMSIFYDINDVIRKHHAILLLRVNTRVFSSNEYELLKEEFSLLPSSQTKNIQLDEQLFSILSYIFEQNQLNKLVYQKSIYKNFKIAKVTAQKRIAELNDKDLILYKRQGRIKEIYITEKGKKLVSNKQK